MKKFAFAVATLALSACASVQPVSTTVTAPQRVFEHNYTLGQPASAYVGDPVVRVRDYWVRTAEQSVVVADRDFTLRMPMLAPDEHFRQGDQFIVTGTNERGGQQYRVVQAPRPAIAMLRFLINADGSFDGRALGLGGAYMGYTYRPEPESVRLQANTASTVLSDRGFTNYEIIYTGASGDTITMMYREFTPQDMARPAYTQNLTYARNSEYVRFRDVRIRVLEATNEQLRYVVESDGRD